MIRLLLLSVLCYLAYTLFRSFMRKLPGQRNTPPAAKSSRGEEMVQDPQCGTYLPRGDALRGMPLPARISAPLPCPAGVVVDLKN